MQQPISRTAKIAIQARRYWFPSRLGIIMMLLLIARTSDGYAFDLPWGQPSKKQSDTKKYGANDKGQGQSSLPKTPGKGQTVKGEARVSDSAEASRPSVRVSDKQSVKALKEQTARVEKNEEPESGATTNAGGGAGSGFTLQKLNQLQKIQKFQSRDGINMTGSNLSEHQLHNQIIRVDNQIRARQGERVAQLQKIIEISKIHQQILATLEKKNESANKVNLTVSDTDEILRQEKIRLIREEAEKNKEFVQALAEEEPLEDDDSPEAVEPKDEKDAKKTQPVVQGQAKEIKN